MNEFNQKEMLTMLIMKIIANNTYQGEFDSKSCEEEIRHTLEKVIK